MLLSLLTPGIDFVKANSETLALVLATIFIFSLGYFITSSTLKRLKPEVFSYYPFDKFFPKSGHWSVIYFIITIILLGVLVFAIIKGGFYLGPA